MTQDTIYMEAEPREAIGTADCRRLRKDGWLPAVVYKDGKPGRNLKLSMHEFSVMLHHHASESLMMDLKVGSDKPLRVYLRDVQHHPVNGDLLHVDFLEVSMDRALRVPVGLELVGDPAGVVNEGGILEQILYELEMECLPGDIVEQFEVDVSHLNMGDNLSVKDLPVDRETYTIFAEEETTIASVVAPRTAEEEEAEAAEEEAAEGEAEEAGEGEEAGEESAGEG